MWKIKNTFTIFDKDGNILSKDVDISQDTFGRFANVWEEVSSRGLEILMDVRENIDPNAEMIGSTDNIKIKYDLKEDQRGEVEIRFIQVK